MSDGQTAGLDFDRNLAPNYASDSFVVRDCLRYMNDRRQFLEVKRKRNFFKSWYKKSKFYIMFIVVTFVIGLGLNFFYQTLTPQISGSITSFVRGKIDTAIEEKKQEYIDNPESYQPTEAQIERERMKATRNKSGGH